MTVVIKNKLLVALALTFILGSCSIFEIDEVTNPNAADASIVEIDASKPQLQSLISGFESRSRGFVATTSRSFGSFGRETLSFRDSDPRFTTDWLGRAGDPDAGFFGVADTYDAPFETIKQGNFLIAAGENTDAITSTELSGLKGYVKTVQGFQYLIPLLAQFGNGIRFEVSDPTNPGPFLSFDEALVEIIALLDEAATDLEAAGDSFFFSLPSGWSGFDTPSKMIEVNRGITARAAIYAEDWTKAETVLSNSFMTMNGGDLNNGPSLTYVGGDGTVVNNEAVGNPFNPFFFVLNSPSTQIDVVHPGVLEDLVSGDKRGEKFFLRSSINFVTNQALPEYIATHQDGRWASNTSNLPFLRNEELVLMYAEAMTQQSKTTDAVQAIDYIRSENGLSLYAGDTDNEALIDEILFQRRYSLWYEPLPHRWVDLRRYDKLSELEEDFIADDEKAFTELARPQGESAWDDFVGGD